MKILLDVNTPAPLARWFAGHEVVRAGQLGWQLLENGELLDAAEAGDFDILLSCDQNIPYQQNLLERRIAVVILSTNHWPSIRPQAGRVARLTEGADRGEVLRIDIDRVA